MANGLGRAIISLLLLVVVASCEVCPPWTLPYSSAQDNTTHCKCGDDLLDIVECNSQTLQVSVVSCYCMTYNEQFNKTLVGRCPITCRGGRYKRIHTNESFSINMEVCGRLKREGQLCGDCIQGYGPAVYSFTYACVECERSHFKYNLLKYIAVAFIPLTGFYLIIIVFKVRATASFMVSHVLICQLATTPFLMRQITASNKQVLLSLLSCA